MMVHFAHIAFGIHANDCDFWCHGIEEGICRGTCGAVMAYLQDVALEVVATHFEALLRVHRRIAGEEE